MDVAGLPGAAASNTARGFIGVAFRSAPHGTAFDCFYLRPTNGRADDQLRRNHAAQYVSEPEFPWERLRTQSPGVYESYVDLETGGWTHVTIDVSGVRARLFVNDAAQPALIVNDLKRGVTSGAIGLWIGPGTEAYFRNLRVDHSLTVLGRRLPQGSDDGSVVADSGTAFAVSPFGAPAVRGSASDRLG